MKKFKILHVREGHSNITVSKVEATCMLEALKINEGRYPYTNVIACVATDAAADILQMLGN